MTSIRRLTSLILAIMLVLLFAISGLSVDTGTNLISITAGGTRGIAVSYVITTNVTFYSSGTNVFTCSNAVPSNANGLYYLSTQSEIPGDPWWTNLNATGYGMLLDTGQYFIVDQLTNLTENGIYIFTGTGTDINDPWSVLDTGTAPTVHFFGTGTNAVTAYGREDVFGKLTVHGSLSVTGSLDVAGGAYIDLAHATNAGAMADYATSGIAPGITNVVTNLLAAAVHNPVNLAPWNRNRATNNARVSPMMIAGTIGNQAFGGYTHTNLQWIQTGSFWRVRQNERIVRVKFWYGDTTNALMSLKLSLWRNTNDLLYTPSTQFWTNTCVTTNLARLVVSNSLNDLQIDLGVASSEHDALGVFCSWSSTNHMPFMATNDTWIGFVTGDSAHSFLITDTSEVTNTWYNWNAKTSALPVMNTNAVVFECYAAQSPLVVFAGDSISANAPIGEAVSWYPYTFATNANLTYQNYGIGGLQMPDFFTEMADGGYGPIGGITNLHPRLLVMMCGINNSSADLSTNLVLQASYTNTWCAVTNAGIVPIQMGLTPSTTRDSTLLFKWNRWLETNAYLYGATFIDVTTNGGIGIHDPAGPPGNYISAAPGFLADTVHPSRAGAIILGRAASDWLGLGPAARVFTDSLQAFQVLDGRNLWPTRPRYPGAVALVSSNGVPFWLRATNGSGFITNVWTGTNLVIP